jgi:hypothetical protein
MVNRNINQNPLAFGVQVLCCFLFFFAFPSALGSAGLEHRGQQSEKSAPSRTDKEHPGTVLFTPTRSQWLILNLEAMFRSPAIGQSGFGIDFARSAEDSETIVILVRYAPNVSRPEMNAAIDRARNAVQLMANYYGWQDWVKIKEDVAMAQTQ